ncbi:MAG: hypothetical protein DRH57_04985 [Candidatus Cloacimonadota bacterium]|nr:MAG: hypothetical protein DRH57_04985 [Candidatus Cloacimonadota bacterium]
MSKEQNVGGLDLKNLSDSSSIFVSDKKSIKMSYRLHDLLVVDGFELMKLKLKSSLVCRIGKYIDEESGQPTLRIDLVDEEKKEIVYTTNEKFYNGIGLSAFLVTYGLIGQWEIVPTDKLCRSYLLGDKNSLLETLDTYNIKISKSADWHIRNEMD